MGGISLEYIAMGMLSLLHSQLGVYTARMLGSCLRVRSPVVGVATCYGLQWKVGPGTKQQANWCATCVCRCVFGTVAFLIVLMVIGSRASKAGHTC